LQAFAVRFGPGHDLRLHILTVGENLALGHGTILEVEPPWVTGLNVGKRLVGKVLHGEKGD
jgi:hypothetical protein